MWNAHLLACSMCFLSYILPPVKKNCLRTLPYLYIKDLAFFGLDGNGRPTLELYSIAYLLDLSRVAGVDKIC